MLFKVTDLQGLKASETYVAFRKFKPPVKKGTFLKTIVCQSEILNNSEVSQENILAKYACHAGFKTEVELTKELVEANLGPTLGHKLVLSSLGVKILLHQLTLRKPAEAASPLNYTRTPTL